MKIAVDVKGTIEGPKQKQILTMIQALQQRGHEVVVWSNLYQFATDAVRKHNLSCQAMEKLTLMDVVNDGMGPMDLAIDDDSSQNWLASKRFLWVHQLPMSLEDTMILVNKIDSKKWDEIGCEKSRLISK
jgi:hypothetical protein